MEAGNNFTYQFAIDDGGSLNVSLPIKFCLTGSTPESDPTWESVTYTFGSPAGNLNGVTVPDSVRFTKEFDGDPASHNCKIANIAITTGVLYEGNYVGSSNISVSSPDVGSGKDKVKVSLNPPKAPNIHYRVIVGEVDDSDNTNCYMTDSSGLLLADCAGNPVEASGSDNGRFAIVTNKRGTGVATNPGQFYYNVTWVNTTESEQTVDVDFVRYGVIPKGAQAIHAAVFSPPFSGLTQAGFDEVNDEIPGGSADHIGGIVVPDGWILWVNYHLEWVGLGSIVYNSTTNVCEDADPYGEGFSITATVTYDGMTESCEAGAWGYLKK
ncbi:hypothetical protein [Desulfurivibrio sp. C05AmB]|uniref:hypothetical protein n=1 Tax=Desulfurivibrio sp. C05AmB TaxID=3374371 RepID=UPI00376EA55F